MTIDQLRPHFEQLMEEWWEALKVGYALEASVLSREQVKNAIDSLLPVVGVAYIYLGDIVGFGPSWVTQAEIDEINRVSLEAMLAAHSTHIPMDEALRLAKITPLKSPKATSSVQVEYLDLEYRAYSQADMDKAIIADWTNRRMATAEFNDCDDFAWRFKAHLAEFFNCRTVGFVLDKSSWHAYNVVVCSDGVARLFEPQLDQWINVGDPITLAVPSIGSGRYSLTEGLILI